MVKNFLHITLALFLFVPAVRAEQAKAPAKRLTLKERIKAAAQKAVKKAKAVAKKTKAAAKKAIKKAKAVAKKAATKTKAVAKKAAAKVKAAAQKAKAVAKKAAAKVKAAAKKAVKKAKAVAKKATAKTKAAAKKANIAAQKANTAMKKAVKKALKRTVPAVAPKVVTAPAGPITTVPGPQTKLTAPKDSALSLILQSGTVRICVRSDIPPFSYFRGRTLRGFDIDLAQKIVLGISIRYATPLDIEWVMINAKNRIPSLQQGRCDMVIAAFSKTPERAKLVSFSTVYLRTHKVMISRKKIIRTPPILATVSGTTSNDAAAANNQLATYFNYNEILGAMKQGLVDRVLTDHPIASYLLRHTKGYKLDLVLAQQESYAIGFNKFNQALKKEVNSVLKYLANSGHLRYFQQRWIR